MATFFALAIIWVSFAIVVNGKVSAENASAFIWRYGVESAFRAFDVVVVV